MVNRFDGHSVDNLIKAIEEVVSRNRSSLNDDDLLTLKQCIETLKTFRAGQYKDLRLVSEFFETLLKSFALYEKFKDLF